MARVSLNYLSAQCPFGTGRLLRTIRYGESESQLPFGSVPFRHWIVLTRTMIGTRRQRVSITFRLSALSARSRSARHGQCPLLSQLPFGSVPFRHKHPDNGKGEAAAPRLNYLSAQCPSGT